MKTRIFPEHNYKGIFLNGKTLRIALDPEKPIEELSYPEFYDVKVTSQCKGNCNFCYMDSKNVVHTQNIIEKFEKYFGKMTDNQKPFQLAFGGGEPVSHPDFLKLIEVCSNIGIVPNYTTNGMWINKSHKELISTTKKYCGGVAVSTHPHLKKYWSKAVDVYLKNDIFTNLHIIISDKKSIDEFTKIYEKYHNKVKYFVLLPLTVSGRCKEANIDWKYLKEKISKNYKDIAFGANFYPYLKKDNNKFSVSLYMPEILSAYLDLENMKVYRSSFSNIERKIGNEKI
jgi:organic radical activating enzyme